jgi:hypothetical protein
MLDVKIFLQTVKTECEKGNWIEAVRLCKELWSKPEGMEILRAYPKNQWMP